MVRTVRALSHGVKRGPTALGQPPGEARGTIYQQLDLGKDIHVRETPAPRGLCRPGLTADRERSRFMQTGLSPCAIHHTFSHGTTDSMCCHVHTVVSHDSHKQRVTEKGPDVTCTTHLQKQRREGELRHVTSPFEERHTSFLASDADVLWNPRVTSSHF